MSKSITGAALKSAAGGLALVALLASHAAWAHHSFAMYDFSKETTLEGVVRDFQWTSPHSWIQVLVPDGAGGTKEWSVECGAPGMMARTGWSSHTLKAGDKVTVVAHPLRTGEASASLVRVTLPDGKVMGPGGPPPPLALKPD